MTPNDVSHVLAKAAAFDQRTVGDADILAWLEAVGDLDVGDALAAVTAHYAEHTDRLMPAHVRRICAERDRDRRRIAREQFEQAERAAIEADPSRRDRSENVRLLLAELRDRLPVGDPDALRWGHRYWREQTEAWQRQQRAVANPAFVGPPPAGGHPVPGDPEPAETVSVAAGVPAPSTGATPTPDSPATDQPGPPAGVTTHALPPVDTVGAYAVRGPLVEVTDRRWSGPVPDGLVAALSAAGLTAVDYDARLAVYRGGQQVGAVWGPGEDGSWYGGVFGGLQSLDGHDRDCALARVITELAVSDAPAGGA